MSVLFHIHLGRYHAEATKRIVREVQQILKTKDLIVMAPLVGVDPHVQEIMAKLKFDCGNGRAVKIGDTSEMVLICGIPGVGKTVLAKCVYNKLHHLYDACSFLEKIQQEIEDKGIVSVQNQLISDLHNRNVPEFKYSDGALNYIQGWFHAKKVLVLLDDVKDHEQLSALVGDLDWFGLGSTVIVTSQRDDILIRIDRAESFVLRTMEQDKALQLFCRHAFEKDSPPEEFKEESIRIAAATEGLPSALESVGKSLLKRKRKREWTETVTALEEAPHESVREAFSKSYKTLQRNEQEIFLDIACFFNGKDKRIPYYMWDDRKYMPALSILSLHSRSWVEIGEKKEIRMCGILKKFGREIVESEFKREPCKRRRLCDCEEALDVLRGGKGTLYVEALRLKFADRSKGNISFKCDQIDGLQNSRFLKLDRADIQGNFGDRLSSLRWLDWQGCPKNINVRRLNLNLQNLVVLNLSGSQVDGDWRGWELLKQARKLKVLKLTGCAQLIATPEFPASMELERLILEGCSKLAVIHPSFGNLTKLVYLNLKGCSCLSELPDLGPMRALKELVIDGTSITRIDFQEGSMRKLQILSALSCERLTEISDSITHLKSVTYLALDGSDIGTLPEPIGSLEQLKTLSLKNCERLIDLPDGIGKLTSLQALDLSNTAISKLPTSVKDLKAMKVLRMRRTFIREFPRAILNLEKLEEIDFSLCRNLEGMVPDEIRGSSSLAVLNLSSTQICALPACLSLLSRLQKLDISRCDKLESLPELPSSLIIVR
ncbi:disease resistance protein RUN1-like isoform X1 [Rhodamnia argentea]|uniref:Disease resistance protein RUN1-like isoform X1 n=1 Tax=Rhodamnia argentea TaxID=178133 RepID=A0ABM3H6X3_9MYRT|nr:disease resistance protein RUN1-like isoform X1 [Rhodamnia argentea]